MKESVYLDTSVISALFDERWPERRESTAQFFSFAPNEYELLTSVVTYSEILATKDEQKRNQMLDLIDRFIQVPLREAAEKLSVAFLEANLVPPKEIRDAQHLAIAVERGCDILASWNFSHMVNVKTQRRLPMISAQHGYFKHPVICSPASFRKESDDERS